MDRSRDLGLPLGCSVRVGGGCVVCIDAEEGNGCRSPTCCCPITPCGCAANSNFRNPQVTTTPYTISTVELLNPNNTPWVNTPWWGILKPT